MTTQLREEFATQVDSQILTSVRELAEREGEPLPALVDEALADLLEKRKNATPRPQVMDAYFASHKDYAHLYKKLAE